MNQIRTIIRNSLAGLPEDTEVFNHARDLRAAGVPVAESISDERYVAHTVGDLQEKLDEAEAFEE